ncbi:zinc-dependent alcohol dehydrogenase [Kineococcus rhizosphaerae]|uniref:L-idonate 5-dehydrogenase/L-gulonate 5-dehydrogenase n=1 Tax=Kineococcus rhizosphaerae TaxID=559628 RepID=A0A2T0QYT1_9ACTN|nr:alcohol dehydrogenase catalytic domain-containing protein [Kineococcus rhizosphaerae]PRY11529.1 L-idonate 5-dehydrogenase/L-gulonate 5-dehydrogenase [Kineococcus rhizosphaerae]
MTRALLLDAELNLSLGDRPPVEPADGDVVLDVAWAGICGSDLHVMATGAWVEDWPATLGHEVAGTVAVSRAPNVPVGTRVVVDSRIPCGACDGCARSARLCTAMAWVGERFPGGYADRLTIAATSVHVVPDGLDLAVAVLAEPLAVVTSALDRVHGDPRTVLLLGHGPIGALARTEIARRWPAVPVTVVEPAPTRAALAVRDGARTHADLTGVDEVFDLVVDAAGYPGSLTDALSRTASGGTVLLVALSGEPAEVVPADIVERSVTIVGSVGFDTAHLPRALAALAADPDRYAAVVTHRIPLADVPEFLARQRHRSAGKVLLRCGGAS